MQKNIGKIFSKNNVRIMGLGKEKITFYITEPFEKEDEISHYSRKYREIK